MGLRFQPAVHVTFSGDCRPCAPASLQALGAECGVGWSKQGRGEPGGRRWGRGCVYEGRMHGAPGKGRTVQISGSFRSDSIAMRDAELIALDMPVRLALRPGMFRAKLPPRLPPTLLGLAPVRDSPPPCRGEPAGDDPPDTRSSSRRSDGPDGPPVTPTAPLALLTSSAGFIDRSRSSNSCIGSAGSSTCRYSHTLHFSLPLRAYLCLKPHHNRSSTVTTGSPCSCCVVTWLLHAPPRVSPSRKARRAHRRTCRRH